MQQGNTTFADGHTPTGPDERPVGAARHSLFDDAEALFGDAKTYVEAELAFQKSRAGFTAGRVKWAAVYGAMAFGFVHLALIALVVGLVIALTPLIGPWLATLVVVIALLAAAAVLLMKVRARVADIRSVFEDSGS